LKITVVINCYNSKKFISETAQSLSSQTYSNFKVLFVDNHSTDESFSTFKANANFAIKYVKTPEFISLYSARNFAIQFIDTPLVCFLDADDLWGPNYLQAINEFHEKYPSIAGCQARTISHRNGKNYDEITKYLKGGSLIKASDFAKISFPALGGISLKKEFLENYRFPEPSNFIGDLDLVIKLAISNKLYFFNEANFFYRIHAEGLTSSNIEGWQKELENWINTKKNVLPRELFHKLITENNYLILRMMINKSDFIEFFKIVFISRISFIYKMKLILRKFIKKI